MKRGMQLSACCLAAVVLLVGRAAGKFARAPEVPVDRLLKNVGAYVKENPKDAQGYYLLGRINALAFDRKTRKLRAWDKRGPGGGKLPSLDRWQNPPGRGQAALTEADLKKHLIESIVNYRKAIELKADHGLYHLGIAWVLESGSPFATKVGPPPGAKAPAVPLTPQGRKVIEKLVAGLGRKDPKVRGAVQEALRAVMPAVAGILAEHAQDKDAQVRSGVADLLGGYWREKAIEHYTRAYELAIPADRKIRRRPLHGLSSLVSYEAGRSWIRLAKRRGLKKGEKKALAKVEEDLDILKSKRRGAITPIIFCLKAHRGLPDLLAGGKTVGFDLDGTGGVQRWHWVKPTTGILVWDPTGRGRITSGRQLFGSVTWWMFWPDGYRALEALDDNRDGWLAGAELKHLAAWFDRNCDGVCDRGEVVGLRALGVAALAVRAAGRTGAAPFNPAGLRLRTGRVLPTYDWIAEPAAGTADSR